MCDCISYNQPKPWQKTESRVLDQARHFSDTGKPKVCVDACIADVIERLWAAGVRTGGCCCGHNGPPPTVFLYDPQYAETAFEILASDHRQWHVIFWAGHDSEWGFCEDDEYSFGCASCEAGPDS